MLYYLLDWLRETYDPVGFGVFQYLTFRSVLAAIFSLLLSLLVGKKIILFLKKKLIGEQIRSEGPQSHKPKAGTPTMGGIILIIAIVIPTLLWADIQNAYIVVILTATLWMGIVGFTDDYIKVFLKNKDGLKAKFKLMGQILLGLIVGVVMVTHPDFRSSKIRIRSDNTIKPNLYLKKIGFQKNDKLIKVDGEDFHAEKYIQSKQNFIFWEYTLERNNGQSIPILKTISVPAEERARTAAELFGSKDEAFMTETSVPFFKNFSFNYTYFAFWENEPGWGTKIIYILVAIFIITAVSNGANITDGLDGLAAGVTAIVTVILGIFAYCSGNAVIASYLNIAFIPQSGELLVFTAAMIGACVGFLWYNAYPAQIFMGDTGSLALGSAVAVLALMVKKELLLPLICGVYFVENLSVMLQVAYFKYTKKKYGVGKRILKMSPLHHHFELEGMHESKIVTRFWIITIILGILTFATLKLR